MRTASGQKHFYFGICVLMSLACMFNTGYITSYPNTAELRFRERFNQSYQVESRGRERRIF